MKKIINIILCLLILAAIIVLGVIIFRYYQYQKNSNEAVEVVAQIEKEFEEVTQTDAEQGNQKVEVEYKGYKVVGIIEIPKINIKYPILNKTNDDSMQYSITKFAGGEVNSIGNFVVAGHNYIDGSIFG